MPRDDRNPLGRGRTGFGRLAAPLAGILFGAALVVASLVFVQPASAFDLTTASCAWKNPVGGSIQVNTPGDPCSIRWGTATQQSGYDFDPLAPQAGLSIDVPFQLGTLTHFNQTIPLGTEITAVDLELAVTLNIPPTVDQTFTFKFNHNETPNAGVGGQCPDTPGFPPPCPDVVTFPSAFPQETFTLDGVTYTLKLLGFGPDAANLLDKFISLEGGTNEAILWAVLLAIERVPEPSTWLLFTMGLGMVGWQAVRRRKALAGLN